jgi:hypothetical protein
MTITYKSYSIRSPKSCTWKDYLRELELKHNAWNNRNHVPNSLNMKFVNDLMQDICPGPYRVVEQYLPDEVNIKLSLEFDDPGEQIVWILKNS